MNSITVKSPAKINLILHVLNKRADGYHNLATLFHRVSLLDTLKLTKRKSGFVMSCNQPKLPTDESNLVTKAYRALQKASPRKLKGLSVHLTKKIPLQAGLGGGSSNAASVLLGANRLYRLGLTKKQLLKIGGRLGADVPFFLHEINQGLGTRKGDIIRQRRVRRKMWFLLVLSRQGLSTKDIFRAFRRRSKPPSLTKVSHAVTMLCDFWERRNLGQIAQHLHNDLESSAFRRKPSLRNIIKTFEQCDAPAVRMSGSGPTVFAVFANERDARKTAKKLKKKLKSNQLVICRSY